MLEQIESLSPESLLSESELSRRTGMTIRFYQTKRVEGSGPRYIKLGNRVKYRWGDVREWLQLNTFSNTSEHSNRGK